MLQCRYLDFVGELFDFVDGGVVLVGELPQLLLAPLGHLLQVGALVLRVTEGALPAHRKGQGQWDFTNGAPLTSACIQYESTCPTSTSDSFLTTSIFSCRTLLRDSFAVVS